MSNAVPRILPVDDDRLLLQVLCDMLTYRLHPAVVQASPDNIAAKVRDGHYDIVVCDLKMPHQGSLKVIRRIKTAIPSSTSSNYGLH
ncbi:MAG TPA: response regulator [Nitrospiraceae bacterium]|nr:response regulator [Nitrospiraceae bacterium]